MRNQRGMTFVELLCVGLLVMLLGGMVLVMAQSSDQMWLRMDARLAGLAVAQRALNLLSEDLRGAKQFGLSCGPGSQVIFTPATGPGPVTYQLNGSTLVKQVGGNPPQALVSDLTAFQPVCPSGGPVVQLQLTAQANTWTVPHTLTAQVWVQNP